MIRKYGSGIVEGK
jgi:hypothetical protein